ncbi:hypothetical protein F4775DRAFT_200615 [Biscogniauxia sp. FL1348]|nr:hypothetical protein F4775DRAFT_200615 [Biscogniauxia sp. FL1348]
MHLGRVHPPSPTGTWAENVQVFDFLKRTVTTAARKAVLGSRVIDSNPGFVDAFWEYERFVEPLSFGLPTWLNRRDVKARDPVPGRWSRGNYLAWWPKAFDFSAQSQGAAFALFLFGRYVDHD